MSGQAGFDSSLDIEGLSQVQLSQQVESSYVNVGADIDSSIEASYQSSISDIGVSSTGVSPSYSTTTEQVESAVATEQIYQSSLDVKASLGVGTVNKEVTSYIEPENAYILSIIADLGINDDMAEEMRLELIMNLLANNFSYEADSAGEGWNTVEETLATKSGDCEDLSNLAASLLLAAGFPPEKVNVYVNISETQGEQGHVVVGLMINDQEVKLDFAQMINDADGNYIQLNESFYANNQLNKAQYEFSYSVNGVTQLSTSISGDIVMEDVNNVDSYFTAGELPNFMSIAADGSYVLNGTDGDDVIKLTIEGTGNNQNIELDYNGDIYNLKTYGQVPTNAIFDIRGGQGNNTISVDSTIRTKNNNNNAQTQIPNSVATIVDGVVTIHGTTRADTINLTKNENGKIILEYNGTRYNLTEAFGDEFKINLNLNNETSNDIVNITDVAVNNITGGAGTSTGTTGITNPHDYYDELHEAYSDPENGGARALMQKAFEIAVDTSIAVAPAGSTKYQQMLYSMANTIEALFDTLLLMSDYMANNQTFTENPGDLYALQQEITQVKDTISTLNAVGSMSTDVITNHLAQFTKDMNS